MNIFMMAKSQDVVVLLKWLCASGQRNYADLARELGMSVGEVHGATKRAADARLFDLSTKRPRIHALKEYLLHGVKYAFPASRGTMTRGMPTSYAASTLKEHFVVNDAKDVPPVWPDPEGKVRGYALEPLFPSVPYAAKQDQQLYELMVLVDALREGQARERNFASEELGKRLDALGKHEALSI